jgi:hypothetical protein
MQVGRYHHVWLQVGRYHVWLQVGRYHVWLQVGRYHHVWLQVGRYHVWLQVGRYHVWLQVGRYHVWVQVGRYHVWVQLTFARIVLNYGHLWVLDLIEHIVMLTIWTKVRVLDHVPFRPGYRKRVRRVSTRVTSVGHIYLLGNFL